LDKARVYELAKELNTTSKRLMEKLAEINVNVKNHMSLLEPTELNALYKHIGVIKHDDSKKAEAAEEKKPVPDAQHRPDVKKDGKKDAKSAPRIIRTTEIIIDTKNDARDNREPVRSDVGRGDVRGDVRNTGNQRPDTMRAQSSSGLRPGFVRDTRSEYKSYPRTEGNKEMPKAPVREPLKEVSKEHAAEAVRPEVKPEVRHEQTPARVEEVKTAEPVQTVKPIDKIEDAAPQKPELKKEEALEAAKVDATRQGDRPQGDRPQGDRPQGDRPQGDRPYGDRPQGDRPYGNRPQGDRPYGDRPQGDRPYNNRPQGDRPYGDRPQGDRPHGDRPQGDRPYNNRPQGDRPYGDRPQGDRPYNNRPQGDRPYGDRPQGDRPYNNRPQGDRPYGDRPQGDRPYINRPQGDRPYGDRPQGDRPYVNRPQGDRPYGDRPQGDRPYGNRPQGDRPYGDRPQGDRPYGDRPQGDRPYGNRPQGDRPYGNRPQGDRPYGNRPQGNRGLEIPKPELTDAQKEGMNSQRTELRREFQNKDVERDIKRDQKKDAPKTQAGARGQNPNQRFKPQKTMLGEKKGVSEVFSDEFILDEIYDNSGVKKSRRLKTRKESEKYIPPRAVLTSITIGESTTVKDLAEALKKTSTDVIKKLMGLGMMATLNQEVDFDTATLIADEFGIKVEKAVIVNEEDILFDDTENTEGELEVRPPVVVVMGHVDHGKTSLLDAIREANVMDTEAGGITQHIGAYMVKIHDRKITFLDTPGHEAFTAMRARGAQVTDIAILVVAADDGVMPQTIEAINHAKAANVSIIVAINKIDKPGADPDKVKQELTQYGIVAEEWGGDAIMVPVSAKKRTNIEQLLEMVLLAADVLELKTDPNRQAKGTIIESKLDKGRGPVATVLVQRGTLKVGDSVVTGTTVGRVRAMTDDKGMQVKTAGPATPVEILGLPDVPEAGEIFYAITDEKVAKQLAEKRKLKQREQTLKATARVTLEDLFSQIKEGKVKDLNIIVKADVQGSVEAIRQSLEKLSNEEVRVRIIHGGVGAITESDVTLAQVSNALIIGFNVRPGTNVAETAQDVGVDLRLYRIIYNAIEDIQAAMKGMLEPTFKEVILGHVEIRQIFKISGVGTIAGGYVTDGKIPRNCEVRIVREGIVAHEGKLASLKRFKDDVKDVAQGYECGLQIEKFNDLKEGDIVEGFIMEEVKR
jgi:translation initiation factor IF-2